MGCRLSALHRLPLLRAFVVVGVAAVFASASGCKRPSSQLISAVSSGARPDRLGPHEAPPGAVELWGLLLPTGSRIERGFGERTYATVPLSPEATIEHLRTEADGEFQVTRTAEGAVIPHVHVRGAEPDQLLWVRVGSEVMGSSRVTVERVHLVPPPSALEHDEVMRKAGLTPDGRLLNPAKQE